MCTVVGGCAVTGADIWLGVLLALAVNELCDLSPWLARKLVCWSAYRRYTDRDRAATRAEELAAFIDDRPGKLFKLLSALGFVAPPASRVPNPALDAAPEALTEAVTPLREPATGFRPALGRLGEGSPQERIERLEVAIREVLS
jgi:hypothetical protein